MARDIELYLLVIIEDSAHGLSDRIELSKGRAEYDASS